MEGITLEIVEDFSHVLQIIEGIKFTMRELKHALKDSEKGLAEKEAQLLELGNVYADFG